MLGKSYFKILIMIVFQMIVDRFVLQAFWCLINFAFLIENKNISVKKILMVVSGKTP